MRSAVRSIEVTLGVNRFGKQDQRFGEDAAVFSTQHCTPGSRREHKWKVSYPFLFDPQRCWPASLHAGVARAIDSRSTESLTSLPGCMTESNAPRIQPCNAPVTWQWHRQIAPMRALEYTCGGSPIRHDLHHAPMPRWQAVELMIRSATSEPGSAAVTRRRSHPARAGDRGAPSRIGVVSTACQCMGQR